MKPRSIMIYGDSGSTKTTQSFFLANYFSKLTGGKQFRIIGANASDSAPFEDSGLIEKGTVDFFDISNRQLALADMRRLAEGYWPRKIKDSNDVYFRSDEKCKTTNEKWQGIGGYIVEGTTGIASLLLNHIRNQDEGVGFKHSYKYEEDGYSFGGLQEGHYGLVQQEMYKLIVQGFACLPVQYFIMTGLVAKGENARTKETVYGPKAAGQATTFEIPSWFMDTWHLDTQVLKNANGEDVEVRVAWFTRHPDRDTSVSYLAKIRCMPQVYPKILEKYPNGFVQLGFKRGLDKFYEELEKANLAFKNSDNSNTNQKENV